MEPVRVAMASVRSVVGDVEGNLRRMEGVIDSHPDADLVCFPELSLTGYSMPSSRDFPVSADDPAIGRILDRSEGRAVCFGYVDADGCIAQSVAEDGRIVGTYRKTHLGEREAGAVNAGGSLPVFRTSKAVVGVSLCWEAHFPEIAGTYALNGADLILMPFASGLGGERRRSSWDRFLPARAYDNTVFVAACNAFGDNGLGTAFGGGACVYDVRGEKLAEGQGECVVEALLDPGQMGRIRAEGYESMRDVYFLDKRRPELYGRIASGVSEGGSERE